MTATSPVQILVDSPEERSMTATQQDTNPVTIDATAGPAPVVDQADTSVADALNALLLRAAVAKYAADRAAADAAAAKAAVVETLRRGATQVAVSPVDPNREIAQVTVSKATWAARIDRARTEEWVKQHYPDKVETRTRLLAGRTEQDVFDVLRTLAPYLLEEIEVVPDHVIRELQLLSEKAQQPMGWGGEVGEDAPPGITVQMSDPQVKVTFRSTEDIDALVDAGVVTLDGHIVGGTR